MEKGVPATMEELEEAGWKKQFVANEPRLSEAAAMYEEAGFEVRLETLAAEPVCETCVGEENDAQECRVCFEGFEDQYKVIYTRPRAEPSAGLEDDLF